MMQKSDFFFELPQGLIAQEPCEPRDAARLMCLARGTDTIEHRVFHDLPALLQAGDLLVINNSKVLPARLIGHKEPTGAVCELLLLRQVSGDVWECLAKPGKRLKTGAQVVFGDGTLKAPVSGGVNPLSVLLPADFDGDGVYELLAYQRITGLYNADGLGDFINTLSWDGRVFGLFNQTVGIFGTEAK